MADCCDAMRGFAAAGGFVRSVEPQGRVLVIGGERGEVPFRYCPWCATDLSAPATTAAVAAAGGRTPIPVAAAHHGQRAEMTISLRNGAREFLGYAVVPTERLGRLVALGRSQSLGAVSRIRLGGTTIFDSSHVEPFLQEWEHLSDLVDSDEDRALCDQVAAMAHRCRGGLDLFLMFTPDPYG